MLKWVFSLVFPRFYAFGRERKSLVIWEVFLGKNRKTKERKDRVVHLRRENSDELPEIVTSLPENSDQLPENII